MSNFILVAPIFKTRYRKKVDAVWNFTSLHSNKNLVVSGEKSRFWVWATHACTYLPYVIWVTMLKSTFLIRSRRVLSYDLHGIFWKNSYEKSWTKIDFFSPSTRSVMCLWYAVQRHRLFGPAPETTGKSVQYYYSILKLKKCLNWGNIQKMQFKDVKVVFINISLQLKNFYKPLWV